MHLLQHGPVLSKSLSSWRCAFTMTCFWACNLLCSAPASQHPSHITSDSLRMIPVILEQAVFYWQAGICRQRRCLRNEMPEALEHVKG